MNRSGAAAPEKRIERRESVLARGFWLCPAISLVLAAVVLILFGVNWWASIVAAGLLGCLIAALWILIADRSNHRETARMSATGERHPREGEGHHE